jgi:4-amino-4-deoxy-L-arabinose transferase-like glycosyltransferase
MNKIQKIAIFFLVFLTVLTRFVALDKVPAHLSNDEISIAYDAYSILHTGRDEHNNFMPVSFQSHSTYKAPLYIYVASVSNYFLGNSEVSVRLPSTILGSLTVFILGFLVFLLTKNINLSIISAFVLAISPWHIYSSRMALESNVAVFCLSFALFLFFKALKNKGSLFLFFSMLFFALSIWAYHTEWLLTPMMMLGLAVIYRKKIKINLFFWTSILVFFVLVFPIANNARINRNTTARANTETIINDPGIAEIVSDPSKSLFKKITIISRSFGVNYSNYTRLGHLFFDGLPLMPKEDPYSVGLFLVVLLPFFVWGLFKIKLYFKNDYGFIYFWILISPVVPSLTIGGANMVRNLASAIPYSLVIGCGLYNLRRYFYGYKAAVFSILLLVSFFYFSIIYYYHFPFQMGENFQYGYKQAAEYIEVNYAKYDRIVVDPRFGDVNIYVGVPHLYLSYFTKLDPQKLLNRKDTDKGLFFDKYQIRSINWNLEEILPKTLYLVPFDNQPEKDRADLITVKEIKLPNYKVEFKLLESL